MSSAVPTLNKATPPPARQAKDSTGPKSGVAGVVSNVAETATEFGTGVGRALAKKAGEHGTKMAKGGVSIALETFIAPVRMMIMSHPRVAWVAKPAVGFLGKKLDDYIQKNNIDFPMEASEAMNELFFGDPTKLSEQVTEVLLGFIEKSLPDQMKDALASGNPLKIATSFGLSLSSGGKGILESIQQTEGNFITKPLRWVANMIPYANQMPEAAKPWAVGAGVLAFGGIVYRTMKSVVKWTAAALAGGGVLAMISRFAGGGSGLMSMLGGFMGGQSGKGGGGGMMQQAFNLFGPMLQGGGSKA